MAYSKARRLSDSISATGEVSAFVDGAIVAADLNSTLDLTGKTITVATASASDNDTTVASTAFVSTAVANLVASAPGTLNTLNELAAALGDDANYATTTTNAIATKLPLAGGTLSGALSVAGNITQTTGDYLYTGGGNFDIKHNIASQNIVISTTPSGGSATSRMRIESGGNVGIGTDSPSAKLDVEVSSTVFVGEFRQSNTSNGDGVNIRIGSSASADYGLRVDTNAGNTPGLVVKGDGHVGIGTFTPNSRLTIQESHQLTDVTGMSANSTLIVGNTGSGNNVYNALHLSGNQQSMFIAAINHGTTASRRLGFFIGSAAGDAVADERISIRGDGKVGIGTTNPLTPLHVVGANGLLLDTEGNGDGSVYFGGISGSDRSYIARNSNDWLFWNVSNGPIRIGTNNTERMRIESDGSVGINMNPTGYAKLTVNGTGTLFGMRASSGAGRLGWYEGGAGRFYMESLNGADGIRFLDGDGSSERMRINSAGNVAIGTTEARAKLTAYVGNPTGKGVLANSGLHIANGTGTNAICQITFGPAAQTNASSYIGELIVDTNGNTHGDLLFGTRNVTTDTAPTERMRIASNGEVRVGTNQDYDAIFTAFESRGDHASITAEVTHASYTGDGIVSSSSRNTANASYRLFQGQRRGNAVVFTVNDAGNTQNINNSFTGISDERLKINIEDAKSQWDDIKALRVRNYEWGHGNTGHKQIGLVSQEVEAAGMTHLIEESPADEYQIAYNSDLEGEKVKTMKYSVLYMKAVKALQEAMNRIETLETKVQNLEDA